MHESGIHSYLQIKRDLLPFFPELLADLWALGSSPAFILRWIEALGLLTSTSRVLDLGCGKGAMSIPLAQRFGCRIEGVDLFEPFIIEARAYTDNAGVASLCSFNQADMRENLASGRVFDLVIYSSVGFILGSVRHTIKALRQCVRPGGYIVLDDGCLAGPEPISRPEYENYLPYEETIQQITSFGDRILREKLLSLHEMKQINDANTKHISRRTESLARQYPDRASLFYQYLEQEKAECHILETRFQGAIWLIEKNPAG